jgi:hypothetical protein
MGLPLMSYKEWIDRTSARGRPRSKELKAVDEELKRYHQFGGGDALWRLQQALDAWKRAQGPGDAWQKSIRNRNGAVAELTAQLGGFTDPALQLALDSMHSTQEHARLGVLYLLSRLHARPDIFNVALESGLTVCGAALNFLGGNTVDGGLEVPAFVVGQHYCNAAMVPGSVILSAAGNEAIGMHLPPDQRQGIVKRVKAMFEEFLQKLLAALREKFGSIDLPIAALKNLVNTVAKIFLDTTSAGIVGGALDLAKGTANFVDAIVQRIRTYIRSRHVVIASGHPEVIVNSIKRAMNLSVLEGLWQAMKGGMSLGLAWATWGTSMVVTALVALFELIVKVVWRLIEIHKMNRLFREAADLWEGRGNDRALHKRPADFSNWFRKHALELPAVSVLVLNSGICGDKMVYLSMYHVLSPSVVPSPDYYRSIWPEFNKGVKYLDSLKAWGVTYLNKCGYMFYSADDFVESLLRFATSPNMHTTSSSTAQKVWEKVLRVANA